MVVGGDFIGFMTIIGLFSSFVLIAGVIGRKIGFLQATPVLAVFGFFAPAGFKLIGDTTGISMSIVSFMSLVNIMFEGMEKAVLFGLYGLAFDLSHNIKDIAEEQVGSGFSLMFASIVFITMIIAAAFSTLFLVASKGCFIFDSLCPILNRFAMLEPFFAYYPFAVGIFTIILSLITALTRSEIGFGEDLMRTGLMTLSNVVIAAIAFLSIKVMPAAVGTVFG